MSSAAIAHLIGSLARPYPALSPRELLRDSYSRTGNTQGVIRDLGIAASPEVVDQVLDNFGFDARPPRTRKYLEPDASGFHQLNTDWHAYWAGFLLYPANIHPSRAITMKVTIRGGDVDHLRNFVLGLGSNYPVHLHHEKTYSAAYVYVTSSDLANAASRLGILPGISSETRRIPLTILRTGSSGEDRTRSFLRGLFDSVGTVGPSGVGSYPGYGVRFVRHPREIVNQCLELFELFGIATTNLFTLRSGASQFNVKRSSFSDLAEVLYGGLGPGAPTVWLERNRAMMRQILYQYGISDPDFMYRPMPNAASSAGVMTWQLRQAMLE